MTNNPPPMYPPDYGQDQNNNVNQVPPDFQRQTTTATISMACGVAGLVLCLSALAWIIMLRGEMESAEPLRGISNLLERILIYGLGMSLGGVLSLIGFVLGLNAIDSKMAIYAVFVSILGPLCMAGWFLALFF